MVIVTLHRKKHQEHLVRHSSMRMGEMLIIIQTSLSQQHSTESK